MSYEITRGYWHRRTIQLVIYLCGGWRTYKDIADELGWGWTKTARRNVRYLEEAGLPVEWAIDPESRGSFQRVRLPLNWVERTPWLRRYIIRKEPLNAPAYRRSLHK